jgi:tRNA(Ile)-lysidine synthase
MSRRAAGESTAAPSRATGPEQALAPIARPGRPLVLAVSGGLDSMVLLEAAARTIPARQLVVATFDHGTGAAARRSARLVVRRARALGLRVEAGRARLPASGEAAWRAARWSFLRHVAREAGAAVVTAHTRDDQVETVLLRALRGAGPRGLAGLYAASAIRRPFLELSRARLRAWADAQGIDWVEDPSNADLRHRRNRVRHQLLPALRAVRPGFDHELLAVARRAAAWRTGVERVARRLSRVERGAAYVATATLLGYDRAALAVLWPAVAARVGLALDRRGTERLVGFTTNEAGVVGGRAQLAGGWEVLRRREELVLRRAPTAPGDGMELPLVGAARWGRWSFYSAAAVPVGVHERWWAVLPTDQRWQVRAWDAGDRMRGPDGRPRRVKRFFRDAGIPGPDRIGWPVVVAGGEIVWIPGVRRSLAATERSGRPGLTLYCELDDRGGGPG